MNNSHTTKGKTLLAVSIAALLLAACASTPPKSEGAMAARAKLTRLQSDPQLATRASAATKEAELAVRAAEQPDSDKEEANFKVYMADRKVDIAIAQARTEFAEDQRAALTQQRDKARLDARTREADISNNKLANARSEIADQKRDAAIAEAQLANERNQKRDAEADAEAARASAAEAARQAAELQRQLDDMHVKETDRGLVLTLGDMLFNTGKAELKPGTTSNLNKLVVFMNNYPDRTVKIEGYTDSQGSDDYNLSLSQRRADAVKSYLMGQGVSAARLAAAGNGESNPIATNDTAAGRQQNRRVEVVISKQGQLVGKTN